MKSPRETSFPKASTPAIAADLRQAVHEQIARYVKRSHALGVRIPMPTVSFDLRGPTAGQAYPKNNHIRLNSVLLSENAQKFIEEIVGHEVAHLAERYQNGSTTDPHGPEWQAIMVAFGLPPCRYHSFDITNAAAGKPFSCNCSGKMHIMSQRRIKHAIRGAYSCNTCHTILRPLAEISYSQTTGVGVQSNAPYTISGRAALSTRLAQA